MQLRVLGCYGGQAKRQNLDRFAESAVVFTRHYVQWPVCGPSRASLMSGLRPDSTHIYGNSGTNEVARRPETHPTLPLRFREHGYVTLSYGKTYHGLCAEPGCGWSEPAWRPPSGWTCYVNFPYPASGRWPSAKWRPAYEIYDGPDRLHNDYQTAERVTQALEKHRNRPFFIAAGFYKPHLPFVAPKHY